MVERRAAVERRQQCRVNLALSRWARQQRAAALWYSLGLFIILQAAGVVLYLRADSARRTAKEQPYG